MENLQDQYISQLRTAKDRKTEVKKQDSKLLMDKIQELQNECLGLSQEKIEVSDQINELV